MINPSSNSPQFSIQIRSAERSLAESGRKISRGEEKTRLIIEGGSAKFNIAVKVTKKGFFTAVKNLLTGHRYVEIKSSSINSNPNKRLFLNINSIAKRCHLTKSEIFDALKQKGGDEKLLTLISTSAQKTESILKNYERVAKKFSERGGASNGEGISPSLLMKTIQIGMKHTDKSYIIKEKGLKFLATYNPKNQSVKLLLFSKKLGAGTFGNVYQLVDVENQKVEALKIAKTKQGSYEDLKNENRILTMIHEGEKKEGIQMAPHQVVSITVSKEGIPIQKVGLLEQKYDGDYNKYIHSIHQIGKGKSSELKWKERVLEFHQLLSGLATMSQMNILHGDLKPENILVKNLGDKQLIHIGDLGGARHLPPGDDSNSWVEEGFVHTPIFTWKEDLALSAQYRSPNERENYINSEKARDVFSMGAIFYKSLTGKLPYKGSGGPRPYPQTDFKYQNIPNIPTELNALIKGMLAKEQKDRITASEALSQLNALIEQYPELKEKMGA